MYVLCINIAPDFSFLLIKAKPLDFDIENRGYAHLNNPMFKLFFF